MYAMEPEKQAKERQKPIGSIWRDHQTGIPTSMREAVEEQSGLSFEDVRVHYNSPQPEQMGALGYTYGNQVYLAPGQERQLGHELIHVWRQKEGKVSSTGKVNGQPLNDDPVMEQEADRLAALIPHPARRRELTQKPPLLVKSPPTPVVQRKVGMEFQVMYSDDVMESATKKCDHGVELKQEDGYKITGDMGNYEYVTEAVDERTDAGIHQLETYCENAAAAHQNIISTLGAQKITDSVDTELNKDGTKEEYRYHQCAAGGKTYYVRQSPNMKAHPQATMGIKLDNLTSGLTTIIQRMEKKQGSYATKPKSVKDLNIGNGGTKPELQLTQQPILTGISQVRDKFPNRSERLNGLIMLLASMVQCFGDYYKTMGEIEKTKLPINAKSAMPFMPRTSTYEIFEKLEDTEKQQIKNLLQPGGTRRFNEIVKDNAYMAIKTGSKYRVTKYDGKIEHKPNVILAAESSSNVVTLGEWVKNLPPVSSQQSSPLQQFNAVDALDTEHLSFGINRPTDIGYDEKGTDGQITQVEGALLELRNLQRNVDVTNWHEIARDVALLCRYINTGSLEEQPPHAQPATSTQTLASPQSPDQTSASRLPRFQTSGSAGFSSGPRASAGISSGSTGHRQAQFGTTASGQNRAPNSILSLANNWHRDVNPLIITPKPQNQNGLSNRPPWRR